MDHAAEDDDDDMAELFSFGSEAAAVPTVGEESTGDAVAGGPRPRLGSDDSLIDMIESEGVKGTVLGGTLIEEHDAETQDILNWLDNEDDDDAVESLLRKHAAQEEEVVPETSPSPPPAEPTIVHLPPVFTTLQEALASKESTSEQVRRLALDTDISTADRPELYCRLICHKSLVETLSSSLADSFDHWTQRAASDEEVSPAVGAVHDWIREQARQLADKYECNADELTKLLIYQLRNGTERDTLLPPVAAALLATGIPLAGCSVVLHQMIPNYMPLLLLPPGERREAAMSMHFEFYLLAVYHLPLLVFHLDRYIPGWQWPRADTVDQDDDMEPTQSGRDLQSRGQLPASWLLSHFAGECNELKSYLTLKEVLGVWDQTFTRKDPSLRFFLTLALLEQAADTLLLLTGSELRNKFELSLKVRDSQSTESWIRRTESLKESTPESVLSRLTTAEDSAVQLTVKSRQERAEKEMKAKMDAEALAHRLAQEKKADEARERLNRARLVAFYRKHMPDKEGNVDVILSNYAGRLDVLEKKLKAKYGEGFNPAFKSKQEMDMSKESSKLLATMNTGVGGLGANQEVDHGRNPVEPTEQVSVLVSASEVLPIFCWSKEAASARGVERKRVHSQKYLKFYIIDARSESAVSEQGKFPTSMDLSPETMMDPEKLKEAEEKFESLRGAAHIVIMGEGFSALPQLYDYKLNPRTQELIQQDMSRIQICALFFVKRGFPFVSVLDGGFAACHSWLVREGNNHGLSANTALVDYVPEASLFGQLEMFHNASGAEKAQRRMQAILDKSLTVVAKRAQQLENFANELDSVEPTAAGLRSLFNRGALTSDRPASNTTADLSTKDTKTGEGSIRNFLSGIGKSLDDESTREAAPQAGKDTEHSDLDSSESERSTRSSNGAAAPERKAPAGAQSPPANAFANLWRRGPPGGTRENPEKPPSSGNSENGGGIGGFLKRNPFARIGAGGGGPSAATKPADPQAKAVQDREPSVLNAEAPAPDKPDDETLFSNPTADAEEEVSFEIGDAADSELTESNEAACEEPHSGASGPEVHQEEEVSFEIGDAADSELTESNEAASEEPHSGASGPEVHQV